MKNSKIINEIDAVVIEMSQAIKRLSDARKLLQKPSLSPNKGKGLKQAEIIKIGTDRRKRMMK